MRTTRLNSLTSTTEGPPHAALLILNYDVTDPDVLAAYRAVAGPLLTGQCGAVRWVTTDNTVDLGEGTPVGSHTVVHEFPTIDAARDAYYSTAYQAVIADRFAGTIPRTAFIVPCGPSPE
ncbi:DUF1330 domain-containing protein [Haloechinothrix halophila]|uniref:DUF1330 domain-containing protein n=1 Tax=Haloechinothrix halophila TaxID=1069073 RepID=UPI0003F9DC21|nr:DUF1330 domain-containing protein [Haloechinothrix halophila]